MATRISARVSPPRSGSAGTSAGTMRGVDVGTACCAAEAAMNARRWQLPSDVHRIAAVVDDIVLMCREAGFSPRQCRLNVPVAITEALANAMLRGNAAVFTRQVIVVADVSDDRLLVEVMDEGQGFDLDCAKRTPDDADWLEREDGRGVFLMRQLMDQVENRCLDAGHLLRLVLRRA